MKARQSLFTQGALADSIFYLQRGRAKLTVVSNSGKQATLTLLSPGEFVGEESANAAIRLRPASVNAITPCTLMKIERATFLRVMNEERALSDLFLSFLLARSMQIQANHVDHLFHSSEKRLARVLLLLANDQEADEHGTLIPEVTQETLAEMIGTTRSRVNYFMNEFRKLRIIEYNGRIRVHKPLLELVTK